VGISADACTVEEDWWEAKFKLRASVVARARGYCALGMGYSLVHWKRHAVAGQLPNLHKANGKRLSGWAGKSAGGKFTKGKGNWGQHWPVGVLQELRVWYPELGEAGIEKWPVGGFASQPSNSEGVKSTRW